MKVFEDAQARIVTGILEINDQFDEKDLVVCVAHGDVIRLAVAHFMGLPLDHFQRLQIAPASITVVHLRKGKAFFGPINYLLDFPEYSPIVT